MPISTLRRYGAPLFVAVLLAGCASSDSDTYSGGTGAGVARASAECQNNPDRCIYKGRYEKGERAYAEAEAKRLNQAQIDRLRRLAAK